jgi:hypothetical protein
MLLMLLAVRDAEFVALVIVAATVPFPWSVIVAVFAEPSPRRNMVRPRTRMLAAGQWRSSRASSRGRKHGC